MPLVMEMRSAVRFILRDGAVVARQSHKLKVSGAIPLPATKIRGCYAR